MTREDLQKMIAETCGTEVAKAIKAAHDRQESKENETGVTAASPRISMEKLAGETDASYEARVDRTLHGEGRAIALGGALVCLAAGKMDTDKAIKVAEGLKAHKSVIEPIVRILTAGEAVNGGVLIAPDHSDELIDLLAPRTVVRRHVRDVQDVSSGALEIPRLTADAATSWGGEIEEIRESQPTFGQMVMRPHQQKVLIPLSNTMLNRGGQRVATIVRNSSLRAMALGEDRAFISSPGSEHRPKGLRYWAPAQNRLAAQAFTGTAAQRLEKVTADLGRLVLTLEEQNVPLTSPVWLMAPRTRMYLMTARDGNGNLLFYDELLQGRLWGWPVETSTHIVRNEGTGADESTIYLFDADEMMLGQGQSLQVDMTTEGTFVDADGNVVSAFQRNLTLLRIINEVDFKPKHAEAVAYLSAVTWQPSQAA
jgi:HK97 family phage major capsid protein